MTFNYVARTSGRSAAGVPLSAQDPLESRSVWTH